MKAHDKCRLCNSGKIEEIIDLGCSPLANAYLTKDQVKLVNSGDRDEIFTPLRCFLCMECGSVQLAHSVPGEVLFSDYLYASSTSHVFVKHFTDFAVHLGSLDLIHKGDVVVDIGSNDGIGLKAFSDAGCAVAGVEPSKVLADIAKASGFATYNRFFDCKTAELIFNDIGKAKMVTATNVFAHLSDLRGFVDAVKVILDPDGVFIFENSYLKDVLDDLLFDTIYMEHQFYHSITPLVILFESLDLPVFRVERIPTHGGSIRVFCGKNRQVEKSVHDLWELEKPLRSPKVYRDFMDRIHVFKHRVKTVMRPFKNVVAYGCPAKFTTICYTLDLAERFDCVVDDSPLKCGLFTPGSHLPIVSKDSVHQPELAFVSAWNFFDSIHAKNAGWAKHWLRPLPNIQLL